MLCLLFLCDVRLAVLPKHHCLVQHLLYIVLLTDVVKNAPDWFTHKVVLYKFLIAITEDVGMASTLPSSFHYLTFVDSFKSLSLKIFSTQLIKW